MHGCGDNSTNCMSVVTIKQLLIGDVFFPSVVSLYFFNSFISDLTLLHVHLLFLLSYV